MLYQCNACTRDRGGTDAGGKTAFFGRGGRETRPLERSAAVVYTVRFYPTAAVVGEYNDNIIIIIIITRGARDDFGQ